MDLRRTLPTSTSFIAAASVADPVLGGDAGDAFVVTPVAGDDRRADCDCDRSDQQIGFSQAPPTSFEQRFSLAEDLNRCGIEAKNRQCCEKPVHQRVVRGWVLGFRRSVKELGGCDPSGGDVVRRPTATGPPTKAHLTGPNISIDPSPPCSSSMAPVDRIVVVDAIDRDAPLLAAVTFAAAAAGAGSAVADEGVQTAAQRLPRTENRRFVHFGLRGAGAKSGRPDLLHEDDARARRGSTRRPRFLASASSPTSTPRRARLSIADRSIGVCQVMHSSPRKFSKGMTRGTEQHEAPLLAARRAS